MPVKWLYVALSPACAVAFLLCACDRVSAGTATRADEAASPAAQFCGYSSRTLTGTFPGPIDDIAFADRIAQIGPNTKTHLLTIHREGPVGATRFDGAKTALMQECAVVIP
jgi:hypothetical protein